jgi:hypothetical protein
MDLYESEWFLKAKHYVLQQGPEVIWMILSAEHGLVYPRTIIEPYDTTLKTMSTKEVKRWANKVILQMEKRLPQSVSKVIFLCGLPYRKHLVKYLQGRGISIEVPMEGLKIGEQLSWLKKHTEKSNPVGFGFKHHKPS